MDPLDHASLLELAVVVADHRSGADAGAVLNGADRWRDGILPPVIRDCLMHPIQV